MSLFQERYSDIDIKMNQSLGDVEIVSGVDAIAQSIKMILGTTPGERLKLPLFGSNLKALLFEPMNDATAFAIETINGSDIVAAETPTGTGLFALQGFGFQPLTSFPAKIDIGEFDSVTRVRPAR